MATDRRPARHAALAAALAAEGLDALLITARANVRYLTGFSGSAGLVVATPRELMLVTDFRYDEQARAEAAGAARVEVERTSVWDRLFREMSRLGPLETVGFETQAITVREAERLHAAAKPWRWSPAGELVEGLRLRKDAGEVAAIRCAAELAGTALRETLADGTPRSDRAGDRRGARARTPAARERGAIRSRPSWPRDRAVPCPMRAPVPGRWRWGSGYC